MASKRRIEFGDFQTPPSLARRICRLLRGQGARPVTLVEPTCGVGNFLRAAREVFPEAGLAWGADVDHDHVLQARQGLGSASQPGRFEVQQADFFRTDWESRFSGWAEPILVVGNPPWVTNAQLGAISGENLPQKSHQLGHRGIDAITGKSNFDISEWMLRRLLESLTGHEATLAMLCKTSVARKVLAAAWKTGVPLSCATIHRFDAATAFGVAVDSCLLVCRLGGKRITQSCAVYNSLEAGQPTSQFGIREGRLVADLRLYEKWRHVLGESSLRWRSGIKHDCAKVMELRSEGRSFRNGLGECIELERDFVFPLLKSSHVVRGESSPNRWMLVPQRHVGQDTSGIRDQAPKTWRYLQSHASRLDDRRSSVYRNRPRFSIFGVGDYSFARWKIAISGFYKRLVFAKVGPHHDRPIVLDDTCYFLPCTSEAEADQLAALLNSQTAREFFSAFVFWDAKRPITIDTLRLLDLQRLAAESSM